MKKGMFTALKNIGEKQKVLVVPPDYTLLPSRSGELIVLAPAHLIHGSSEGHFVITYCPGKGENKLSKQEIEGVGFKYGDLDEITARYNPETLKEGYNTMADGEEIYYISSPALGLWAFKDRFEY